MSEIWSSQCAINLSSWKSNLKYIQAWTGFEPMTLRLSLNFFQVAFLTAKAESTLRGSNFTQDVVWFENFEIPKSNLKKIQAWTQGHGFESRLSLNLF